MARVSFIEHFASRCLEKQRRGSGTLRSGAEKIVACKNKSDLDPLFLKTRDQELSLEPREVKRPSYELRKSPVTSLSFPTQISY